MARRFYVEIGAHVGSVRPENDLESLVDRLMDALLVEPGIDDADLGADFGAGRIAFCFHLRAEDSVSALRRAHVVARSAAHAVGASTPAVDGLMRAIDRDDIDSSVRPADAGPAVKHVAASMRP